MQWDNLSSMLQGLQLESRPNRLRWIPEVMDIFLVSSARSYLDDGMLFLGGTETWSSNWVPIKHNILVRRIHIQCTPLMRDCLIEVS